MLAGFASRIQRLIDSIGRDVNVRVIVNTGTAFDPTQTPTDTPARAAITMFKAKEIDNSLVQADDKKAYISAVSAVTKQDQIIDNGLAYSIVDLRLVDPGDEPFLYIAQLRA